MLKPGIWERKQISASPPQFGLGARIRHKFARTVSLDLLRMPLEAHNGDVDVFERIIPYVRLSSGVFRTTYRERFQNLDPVINRVLAECFSSSVELCVEDCAASTCLTSSEWAQTLMSLYPRLRFGASDILLHLVEMTDSASGERFVFEPDGCLLQYIRPPFVIRMEPPESWVWPVNWLLYLHARRRWRQLALSYAIPESWSNTLCDEPVKKSGYCLRKISLVHPQALALARRNFQFAIRCQSLFDLSQSSYHVVRSMNILNKSYFSDERLAHGAQRVIRSLLPGGIWIVGRTSSQDPGTHNVTIFRKQNSGALEIIQRIGEGSEIESIALGAAT